MFASALLQSRLQAQTAVKWTGLLDAGPHLWNLSSNWTGAAIPDSITERGDLAVDWTAAATINVTGATTINGIIFDDTGGGTDVGVTVGSSPTSVIVTLAGTTPLIQTTGSTLTITSVLAGTTAWTKNGGGTLILNAANTNLNGALTISDGVLRASNGGALGGMPTILVSNVAPGSGTDTNTFQLAGGATYGAGKVLTLRCALGGGQGRSAITNQSGNNTWAGNIIFESPLNQTLQSDSGTTFTVTGNLINGTPATTQFFLRGAGNGILNGTMSVGTAIPVKTEGGTWTINSTGNVHGAFGLSNGTIVVNNHNALYPLVPINFGESASGNTGTLTINAGFIQATTGLSVVSGGTSTGGHQINGAGTLDLGWPARTLTVNDVTAANDLTISTPIIGTGGFVKTGTGRLVVRGTSVQGPATVSAGFLAASGAFNGGISMANGTSLAAGNLAIPGTLVTPTLAFASGTTTLLLDVGNGVDDGIQVTAAGGLTQAGTTTIEISPAGSFSVAIYPLISYTGTSPGLGGFALGTLPAGVTATLIDTGSAIALNVTAVDKLAWTGEIDGTWDTTIANWDIVGPAGDTTFTSKDDVVFPDGAANTAIALVGTVDPSRVEFTNDVDPYMLTLGTLSGGGVMDLIKSGDGEVVLLNANTYSGITDIQAGTLELDHDGGTMTSTSGIVVASGATFKVTDDDGGFTVNRPISGGGTIRVNPHSSVGSATAHNVTFSGAAAGFSGSLILETPLSGSARLGAGSANVGSATIIVENENQFWGTTGNTYANSITLTGDGFQDTSGSIGALRMDGSTWNGPVTLTGTGNDSAGVNFDARIGGNGGTSTINGVISGGDLNLFGLGTSSPTIVMTAANTYGDLLVGSAANAEAGGTVLAIVGDNLGTPVNTTATLGSGTVYLTAGSNATPKLAGLRIRRADGYTLAQNVIGQAPATAGFGALRFQAETAGTGLSLGGRTVDISDGTNGGLLSVGAATAGAILNIDSGSIVDTGNFYVGDASGLSGTVNQTGGTVTIINQLRLGHFGNETGTYNLTNGTVAITGASPTLIPNGGAEQNGGIYVGVDGQGVLNQSGGSVTTNFVVLDNRGNSVSGTNMLTGTDQYNLNLGTLSLKSQYGVIQNNTSTEFNLGGGTITIDNTGIGTGTGASLTVPLNTIINVTGTGSILDTNVAGNSFSLLRNLTGSGTVTLNGGGEILLNPAAPQTITAVLAGANPLAKIGASSSTIASASTLTGPTSVEVGTLNVAGSLNASDVSVFDGASIGGEGSVKSLVLGTSGGSNLLIHGGTPAALTVNAGVVLNGTATVDFAGTPTTSTVAVLNYSGGLSGGTVANFTLANSGNYRSSSFSDSGSAISLNLDIRNLTWTGTDGVSPTVWNIGGVENWTDGASQKFYNGDSVTFNDTPGVNQIVAITGNVQPEAVTFDNSAISYTLNGTVGNGIGGTASLTKSGTGLLTLAAANTFTGPVTVNGGTVKLATGGNNGLGTGNTPVTVASGGQVNFNGIAPAAGTTYSVTIAGNGPDSRGALINETAGINATARVLNLTLSGDASVGAYGGTGDGNRIDLGYNDSIFGTINGGGFTLTKVGPAMVGMRAPASNITYVINEGILRGENSPLALGTNTVTVNGGRLDSWGNLSWAVPVDLKTGTSLTSSSGTATWTGGLTLTGNVTIGGGATTTVASVIGGTGSLIKGDGGTLILSEANTYGGATTLLGGILQANHNAAFKNSVVTLSNTVTAGRVVVNGGVTVPNNIVVGSGTQLIGAVGRGLLESAGTGQGVFSGTVTVASTASSGGTLLGGAAVGNELVFNGPFNTTAGVALSQRDGRVIFAGGGTATGSSLTTTGVTLLGADQGIPSGISLILGGSGNATLEMGGFDQTLAGLTRNANTTVVTNSAVDQSTLNLNVAAGASSYPGLITGNLALTKLGAGTVELSNQNNTYIGGTTVSAGTLQLTNLSGSATGTGPVTVNGTGILAGTGIITSDVNASGVIAPGITTGNLTVVGSVTFNPGSTLRIDLNDASAPKKDLLAVSGALSASGATLDFDVTGALAEPTYIIATYTGSAPAGFTAVDVPSGYTLDYNYNGNSIALVNAYFGWAAEKGLTAGVNDGKLQDPDNDGVPNVLEFATDGEPLSGVANPKIRSVITDVDSGAPVVNALTITLPVRIGAAFSGPGDLVSASVDGLVYRIQSSADLSDFLTANVTEVIDNAAIITELNLPGLSGDGWTYRTFRAPGTPGTPAKQFIRAVVD